MSWQAVKSYLSQFKELISCPNIINFYQSFIHSPKRLSWANKVELCSLWKHAKNYQPLNHIDLQPSLSQMNQLLSQIHMVSDKPYLIMLGESHFTHKAIVLEAYAMLWWLGHNQYKVWLELPTSANPIHYTNFPQDKHFLSVMWLQEVFGLQVHYFANDLPTFSRDRLLLMENLLQQPPYEDALLITGHNHLEHLSKALSPYYHVIMIDIRLPILPVKEQITEHLKLLHPFYKYLYNNTIISDAYYIDIPVKLEALPLSNVFELIETWLHNQPWYAQEGNCLLQAVDLSWCDTILQHHNASQI